MLTYRKTGRRARQQLSLLQDIRDEILRENEGREMIRKVLPETDDGRAPRWSSRGSLGDDVCVSRGRKSDTIIPTLYQRSSKAKEREIRGDRIRKSLPV